MGSTKGLLCCFLVAIVAAVVVVVAVIRLSNSTVTETGNEKHTVCMKACWAQGRSGPVLSGWPSEQLPFCVAATAASRTFYRSSERVRLEKQIKGEGRQREREWSEAMASECRQTTAGKRKGVGTGQREGSTALKLHRKWRIVARVPVTISVVADTRQPPWINQNVTCAFFRVFYCYSRCCCCCCYCCSQF